MSLTSYRAAPPRGWVGLWAPGSSPDLIRGPGVAFDQRRRAGAGSLASYEPDELPGCSTPRAGFCGRRRHDRGSGALLEGSGVGRVIGGEGGFGEPGGDLLFRRLSGSTIGAEGFHGRVRDGIGCFAPRCGHQAGQTSLRARAHQRADLAEGSPGLDPGPTAAGAGREGGDWRMREGKCLLGSVWPGALALAAARGR